MTPDDRSINSFSQAMKAKMRKKLREGKGGWRNDCTIEYLSSELRRHVEKGDPIDVANFCMMIHQRDGRIT